MSFSYNISNNLSLIGFDKIDSSNFIKFIFINEEKQIITNFNQITKSFSEKLPFDLTDNQINEIINATFKLDDTRPWGNYKTLAIYPGRYLMKKITVLPNKRISLQYHNHREEIWEILSGSGFVELDKDKKIINVTAGSKVKVRLKQIHRVTAGNDGVVFQEIQQGNILEESDIVRVEDDFGRV